MFVCLFSFLKRGRGTEGEGDRILSSSMSMLRGDSISWPWDHEHKSHELKSQTLWDTQMSLGLELLHLTLLCRSVNRIMGIMWSRKKILFSSFLCWPHELIDLQMFYYNWFISVNMEKKEKLKYQTVLGTFRSITSLDSHKYFIKQWILLTSAL